MIYCLHNFLTKILVFAKCYLADTLEHLMTMCFKHSILHENPQDDHCYSFNRIDKIHWSMVSLKWLCINSTAVDFLNSIAILNRTCDLMIYICSFFLWSMTTCRIKCTDTAHESFCLSRFWHRRHSFLWAILLRNDSYGTLLIEIFMLFLPGRSSLRFAVKCRII